MSSGIEPPALQALGCDAMYDARSGVGDLGAGPRRHISLSQAQNHTKHKVQRCPELLTCYRHVIHNCDHRHVVELPMG